MRRVHFVMVCTFLLLWGNLSIDADEIIIAADTWCPVNCDPKSSEPGFMVEIAQHIFSRKGHRVEYQVIPWARAIIEARNGKINGIIGAYHGDAPDFIFPQNELALIGMTFFVTKTSNWTYQEIASLDNVTLGAIIDYDYGPALSAYIDQYKFKNTDRINLLSGASPLGSGIQMLLKHRIDTIIEAEPVFWYETKQRGIADRFKIAGRATEPLQTFIAFSPILSTSTEYAEQLSEGITLMRNSGKLNEILAKYGLKDWK